MYKKILFILILATIFIALPYVTNVEANSCSLESIIFSPSSSEINPNTWYDKENHPTFTITVRGTAGCEGVVNFGKITLTQTRGVNDDVAALEDIPFGFGPGENGARFTLQAGTDECVTSDITYDCQLYASLYTKYVGNNFIWSSTISGSKGELKYNCPGNEMGESCKSDKFGLLNIENLKINSNSGGNSSKGTSNSSVSEKFEAPFNIKDFRTLLGGIINWLIRLAIPVAILMITVSGVMYMTGGDKPDLIVKAKKMFLWAIAGLAIIFLSKGIEGLVKSILDLAK